MTMRRALLLVVLLAACEKTVVDRPGDCLPLPGAARASLIADPRGGGLYWLEPVRRFDYDSQLSWYWKLVRYDLHSRRLETLYDHVETPLYIFDDKMLMIRTDDGRKLVLQPRGGKQQSLLPHYLSPVDAEMIDDDRIAVLADGDGPRAVYTIDLARPRPHALVNADTLLSTEDGVAYTWVGADGVAVDIETGEEDTFAQRGEIAPLGDELLYVDGGEVVAMSMAKGTTRTVIEERNKWKLVHQNDAVLARTPVVGGRSYAALIERGRVTMLPTLNGGTTLLGVTKLGAQTWALVAHDTANYDGDLTETEAETEVCLLPDAGEATFKTRLVPGRYAHKQHALVAALARVAPGAGFQILDYAGSATSVFIELPEPGGGDLEAMRKRVTQLHEQVTSQLEDREVMTELRYADLQTAAYRWRRSRLRFRASAGMGNVTIADARDYDLELTDADVAMDGTLAKCKGTLANLTKEVLKDLQVRCVLGDRVDNLIDIAALAPGETHELDETFDADWGDSALLEVVRDREPLEVLDRAADKRQRAVLDLAIRTYKETDLALYTHDVSKELEVRLLARRGFDKRTEAQRAEAVEKAYKAYMEGLHEIYDLADWIELSFTIDVDHSETRYTYDGATLELKR